MAKIIYSRADLMALNQNCNTPPENAQIPEELSLSNNPHATPMFRDNSGCKPLNFKKPFHDQDHDQDHPNGAPALTVR